VDDVDLWHDPRLIVLTYLEQLVNDNRVDRTWPVLQIVSNVAELWRDDAQYVFVIAEDPTMADNHVGLAVILDLLKARPGIVVGRTMNDDARNIRRGVYVMARGGSLTMISRETDEEGIVKAMNDYVGPGYYITSTVGSYLTTTAPITPAVNDTSIYRPNGIHMTDLEAALYRSLWMEIAIKKSINAEELSALKKYVEMLHMYHPGETHVKVFLSRLNAWVQTLRSSLSTSDWIRKFNSLQSPDGFIPSSENYTGCRGSSPRYRGYTCSLWKTFHAITVSAYRRHQSDAQFHPMDVLGVIAQYVRYFFACTDCAKHFAQMVRTMREEIRTVRDVVLWLWRAHNRVNHRLHSDTATEDPRSPKIQFPPYMACAACYRATGQNLFEVSDDVWRLDEVFNYLLQYYARESVIDDHDESANATQLSAQVRNN
jgi:thiol oxidase